MGLSNVTHINFDTRVHRTIIGPRRFGLSTGPTVTWSRFVSLPWASFFLMTRQDRSRQLSPGQHSELHPSVTTRARHNACMQRLARQLPYAIEYPCPRGAVVRFGVLLIRIMIPRTARAVAPFSHRLHVLLVIEITNGAYTGGHEHPIDRA